MNHYLRYLSDKRFRDTVNQLKEVYEEILLFGEDSLPSSNVREDWIDAATEAVSMVLEGSVALDDEKAAKHLPVYEEWLQRHPTGIDLNAGKEPETIQ